MYAIAHKCFRPHLEDGLVWFRFPIKVNPLRRCALRMPKLSSQHFIMAILVCLTDKTVDIAESSTKHEKALCLFEPNNDKTKWNAAIAARHFATVPDVWMEGEIRFGQHSSGSI